MASPVQNVTRRMMNRVRRLFGVVSSSEISDSRKSIHETVHFGMYNDEELRHLQGVHQPYGFLQQNRLTEENIGNYLNDVSSSTRKKIDEIKNLKILAPEIEQAAAIIVSSILSPSDLQTDSVTIAVDSPALSADLNAKISDYLTNYFNTEYHLGPKLVEWLKCAGFEEGAKPILVLPRNQIDVLNVVADKWDPETLRQFREIKSSISKSTEGLLGCNEDSPFYKEELAAVESVTLARLQENHIGSEYISKEDKDALDKKHEAVSTAAQLAKVMTEKSFKLLRTAEQGDAIVVTRDMSAFGKNERKLDERISELTKEAERQIRGFDGSSDDGGRVSFPVLTINEVVKTQENDLPIVIELPCDSVIPVCAPRDNKNHIGYYVLIDENGQPCRGQYSFSGSVTTDVNNRLATNAAKSVYGGAAISTYTSAGLTDGQTIDQMTQVFAVAVNHLLEAKLRSEGLSGLDINVHEAVGKSLFFNLLAKNKIKMVFVPAPMMTYYRFAHREDGTGKTFLEDIAYILALRCTLTIAKIMAAVDNATKHRKIEVNVDEKNQNVLETLELVRHSYLNKKAPAFTNDPTTAAENIINQHLSIVPKGLVGNTDDLNITTETGYGQSQAPDNDLMDTLGNWVGMGLKLPPSALNQLNETEYAKSVATSNLFFSNAVRGWQNIIRPFNKKFCINYILCNAQMLNEIRSIIQEDFDGKTTVTKDKLRAVDKPDSPSEVATQDPEKDQGVEVALKRVIATVDVVLAPPNMSTSKAHFEEVNAQVDAVDKVISILYPDDVAPSDELKNLMSSVRSIIASKALREFLPKLGFHEIAAIPDIKDVDSDESASILLHLGNIKRRMDGLAKMQLHQLADQVSSPESVPSSGEGEIPSEETGEGEGENGGMNEFNI